MKLLIIDSNAAVRRLIRTIVADLAFDIQECSSGADVMPAYQSVMPDFAVLEMDIDESCGIALTKRRRGRVAAGVGAVCLLVLAFVAWMGTEALWHHFSDLQDWMRLAMSKDGLRMFWQKPVLGFGLGTFTTVYPQFRSFYTNLFVNAAHNDYVQVLVETGLVGFAAVVWFIVEVYRAGLRNVEDWNRD